MPVQVDTPINTGAETDWKLWGAGATDKMAAVATNDGDTSVIYALSGGRVLIQLYQFPALVGVADPVNSASLTAITRESLQGGGGRSLYAYWNSVQVGSNRQAEVHLARPNYVTVTYAAAGAGLGLAVVNGEHGFLFSAAGGPSQMAEYYITHLYRTVDFNYAGGAAGEFSYIIGSLAGAVIGTGLLFREMPRLARYIFRRSGILIRPDEYEVAFRAWRHDALE